MRSKRATIHIPYIWTAKFFILWMYRKRSPSYSVPLHSHSLISYVVEAVAVNLFVLVVYVSVFFARDFAGRYIYMYIFHARNDGVKALGILAHNHTAQYTWALVRGFLLMPLRAGIWYFRLRKTSLYCARAGSDAWTLNESIKWIRTPRNHGWWSNKGICI